LKNRTLCERSSSYESFRLTTGEPESADLKLVFIIMSANNALMGYRKIITRQPKGFFA